jgi:hypothetical protein
MKNLLLMLQHLLGTKERLLLETKMAVGVRQLPGRIKWVRGENVMMQLKQDPGRRIKALSQERTA